MLPGTIASTSKVGAATAAFDIDTASAALRPDASARAQPSPLPPRLSGRFKTEFKNRRANANRRGDE